jgi:preprotein translocase subunit SecD
LKGNLKWKILLICILVGIAGWYLFPSTRFALTTQSFDELREADIPDEILEKLNDLENTEYTSRKDFLADLEKKTIGERYIPLIVQYASFRKSHINLGLDLQGGVHLVLEVQAEKFVENELVRLKDSLSRELKKEGMNVDSLSVESANELKITAPTPEDIAKIDKYIAKEVDSLEKKGMLPASTTLTVGFRDDLVERWESSAIDQALMTIRNRVDEFGLTEPVIQRQGKNRVIVELAGEKDPQRAVRVIGRTAELRFQLVKDAAATKEELLAKYPSNIPEGYEILPATPEDIAKGRPGAYLVEKEAKVTGADLKDARVTRGDGLEMYVVSFEFDRDGSRSFAKLTEDNINKQLAIVLDGTVQSAPVIRTRISGQGQVEGDFPLEEAQDLALVLRAGALPAPVKILENISVGPTLGEDSIKAGKNAIIIGSIVVVLFMIIYYKFSGVIADLTLLFNLLFIMGVLAIAGATLTLPGLAGIALTVGMAVDANVLIFERIKEELRLGKTLRSAVENGFSRANLTILDANLTTLIAAAVLFQFGTGPIKGFAVTLSVGILSTLFTVLVLSKVIFDLFLQSVKVKQLSI